MISAGKFIYWSFFIVAASSTVAADFSDRNGFSISAGSEYQRISQEFYNSILDTISVDYIETWYLDKDEIDDVIFRSDLGYDLDKPSHRLGVRCDLELSGDRLLGRSEGFYRKGDFDNNVKIFGKFESRSTGGEDGSRDEGYSYFQTYLGGKGRLGRSVSTDFRLGFEKVIFAGDVAATGLFTNFDYSLFSGRVGGEFYLSEPTSELSWSGRFAHREVLDSSDADYDQCRFDVAYSSFGVRGYLNLEAELEYKDYARPLGRDDFTALALVGRLGRSLGDRYELRAYLMTDIYRFDQPDIINRDYQIFRGELKGSIRHGPLDWGPLARLEFRGGETPDDTSLVYFREGYSQWMAGSHGEILNTGALYISGEAGYGKRLYSEEAGILSSYEFWSLSIIGNISVAGCLTVTLLFDGQFERHRVKEDNSSLYFFSIGANARI